MKRGNQPLANVSCRVGNGLPLASTELTLVGTGSHTETHCKKSNMANTLVLCVFYYYTTVSKSLN